eukprot:gnl/TRDRNA2_/TRDRNA2_178888_c0_seq1.p1 gnl/TRDRNA2_/TRDRNA2_178888_c0~~gnl/TRDRNA2_/TRDRNA2_178888_c0_seq1.p1  ORF type:complete len:192 (-),score=22.89 gnl/TRDRNA2_/TRDRNA2_178888_c0_seq1:67-573(-)
MFRFGTGVVLMAMSLSSCTGLRQLKVNSSHSESSTRSSIKRDPEQVLATADEAEEAKMSLEQIAKEQDQSANETKRENAAPTPATSYGSMSIDHLPQADVYHNHKAVEADWRCEYRDCNGKGRNSQASALGLPSPLHVVDSGAEWHSRGSVVLFATLVAVATGTLGVA